jgi:hypothetical protein
MLQRSFLFSLSTLIACSGDDKVEDTSDTQEGVAPIVFSMSFTDGFNEAPLVGAEICVLEPDLGDEEDCISTDAMGLAEWTWMEPAETNFLNRLTLPDYMTTLYLGRYDDQVSEMWTAAYGEGGVVELENFAFSESIVDLMLQIGGTSHQEGSGHAFFGLLSQDEGSLAGATFELSNESGESVGEVLYVNAAGTGFDTSLESTSEAGFATIANVPPGTYTFTVDSSDFTCTPGFAWRSDVANTTTVVVEADSMTMGSMLCTGL